MEKDKAIFNVNRGVNICLNNQMGRELVELLFDLDDLPPHLFALAEQINYKLSSSYAVEHPQANQQKAAS